MTSENVTSDLSIADELLRNRHFRPLIRAVDRLQTEIGNSADVDPNWLLYRGFAYYFEGDFQASLLDFEKAVQLNSNHLVANITVAYILACCPDGSFWNGSRAVTFAHRACQLTQWKDWRPLQCLAAAYARLERFSDAEICANAAKNRAPPSDRPRIDQLLKLLHDRQAYTADLNDDFRKILTDPWEICD